MSSSTDSALQERFDAMRRQILDAQNRNPASPLRKAVYWRIAYRWFIAGASAFHDELLNDDVPTDPLDLEALLVSLANVQVDLHMLIEALQAQAKGRLH